MAMTTNRGIQLSRVTNARRPYMHLKCGFICGRLTVMDGPFHNHRKAHFYLCKCSCGKRTVVARNDLNTGRIRSCGCYKDEVTSDRNAATLKHGMCGTRTYRIWRLMISRCSHDRCADYKARGITVCQRWRRFENFHADMGDAPAGLSIGRIDNDGPYHPSNCRWETASQQARNKRDTRYVTLAGVRMCAADAAQISNINYGTFITRLNSGMSADIAATKPVHRKYAKKEQQLTFSNNSV